MADNYVEFSEVLGDLSGEEEAWLEGQLQPVYVFGEQEYPEDAVPAGLDPAAADWYGARAWRDLESYDPEEDEPVGFEYQFLGDDQDGKQRHLWFYADEFGSPERIAHLVQKFLRQFHPDRYWTLSYAATCSKPRAGEFGGGCVFVTANKIEWCNTWDFLDTQIQAFQNGTAPAKPLVQLAASLGLTDEDLDEIVHDVAAKTASDVNNGGIPRQVDYLVRQLGEEGTERALRNAATQKGTAP